MNKIKDATGRTTDLVGRLLIKQDGIIDEINKHDKRIKELQEYVWMFKEVTKPEIHEKKSG